MATLTKEEVKEHLASFFGVDEATLLEKVSVGYKAGQTVSGAQPVIVYTYVPNSSAQLREYFSIYDNVLIQNSPGQAKAF